MWFSEQSPHSRVWVGGTLWSPTLFGPLTGHHISINSYTVHKFQIEMIEQLHRFDIEDSVKCQFRKTCFGQHGFVWQLFFNQFRFTSELPGFAWDVNQPEEIALRVDKGGNRNHYTKVMWRLPEEEGKMFHRILQRKYQHQVLTNTLSQRVASATHWVHS